MLKKDKIRLLINVVKCKARQENTYTVQKDCPVAVAGVQVRRCNLKLNLRSLLIRGNKRHRLIGREFGALNTCVKTPLLPDLITLAADCEWLC